MHVSRRQSSGKRAQISGVRSRADATKRDTRGGLAAPPPSSLSLPTLPFT